MALFDLGEALRPTIGDEWTAMLSSPEFRAGLMQTGLQLMQAPQPGQNFLGQLGSAVGSGFEAAGRTSAFGLEQQQAEIERQRREAAERRAEEALQIDRARLELTTQDTASKIAKRKATPTTSAKPVSATALFNAERRKQERLSTFLREQATDEFEGTLNPELLNDPIWRKRMTDAFLASEGEVAASTPAVGAPNEISQPGALKAAPRVQPPPHHIKALFENLGNPKVRADFDAKYGPGSAEFFLQGPVP